MKMLSENIGKLTLKILRKFLDDKIKARRLAGLEHQNDYSGSQRPRLDLTQGSRTRLGQIPISKDRTGTKVVAVSKIGEIMKELSEEEVKDRMLRWW